MFNCQGTEKRKEEEPEVYYYVCCQPRRVSYVCSSSSLPLGSSSTVTSPKKEATLASSPPVNNKGLGHDEANNKEKKKKPKEEGGGIKAKKEEVAENRIHESVHDKIKEIEQKLNPETLSTLGSSMKEVKKKSPNTLDPSKSLLGNGVLGMSGTNGSGGLASPRSPLRQASFDLRGEEEELRRSKEELARKKEAMARKKAAEDLAAERALAETTAKIKALEAEMARTASKSYGNDEDECPRRKPLYSEEEDEEEPPSLSRSNSNLDDDPRAASASSRRSSRSRTTTPKKKRSRNPYDESLEDEEVGRSTISGRWDEDDDEFDFGFSSIKKKHEELMAKSAKVTTPGRKGSHRRTPPETVSPPIVSPTFLDKASTTRKKKNRQQHGGPHGKSAVRSKFPQGWQIYE